MRPTSLPQRTGRQHLTRRMVAPVNQAVVSKIMLRERVLAAMQRPLRIPQNSPLDQKHRANYVIDLSLKSTISLAVTTPQYGRINV